MKIKTIRSKIILGISNDKLSYIFVWSVWIIMLLSAFACVVKYGKNIPLAEDWNLVAPLTGNEPDLSGWLWAQNNEHRVPLPRLIFFALLKITGDFRVGMFFNVITLGVVSFLMILAIKHLRGGKTDFADAVFPIALLHLGNWENLVWSWQLSFILPVALILVMLLLLTVQPIFAGRGVALLAGIFLICLPLCGAIGLIFVPFLAFWFIYCGIIHWKLKLKNSQRLIGCFLISSAISAAVVSILYFVGYERPTWNPPSPGIAESLKTTAKYLALGFGPVAEKSWGLSAAAAFGFLIPSIVITFKAVFRQQNLEKYRAFGIAIFFLSTLALALGIGYGRAGLVPTVGLPMRYVSLAAISFLTAFFIWELYGKPSQKKIFQRGLLIIMCCLIPLNTMMGFHWRNWYVSGMSEFEQDLTAGTPASILAKKHKNFLIHWWDEEKLAQHIKMLHDEKIGIFAQLKDSK